MFTKDNIISIEMKIIQYILHFICKSRHNEGLIVDPPQKFLYYNFIVQVSESRDF